MDDGGDEGDQGRREGRKEGRLSAKQQEGAHAGGWMVGVGRELAEWMRRDLTSC